MDDDETRGFIRFGFILPDEDEPVPLMLSLGSSSPSYSSHQIRPVISSLRLAPPSPSRMTYSTSPSPYQMVSRGSSSTPTTQPTFYFIPPSNHQATPELVPAVTSAVQSNGSSQPAGDQNPPLFPSPYQMVSRGSSSTPTAHPTFNFLPLEIIPAVTSAVQSNGSSQPAGDHTPLPFPSPYQMVSRGSSSTPTAHPTFNFLPLEIIPAVTSAVQSNGSSQLAGDHTPPPFPWATNRRGEIHSLEYLEAEGITTITGDVKCKHCEKVYQVSYNLRERFAEVEKVFMKEKRIMRERAPHVWKNPEPRRCEHCGHEKAVKPVIAYRKRHINWLFMLLGQTLGYCTLQQLKNFCKHRKSHRTGAKDRVIYLTYLGLCKMLQPNRDLFSETGSKR